MEEQQCNNKAWKLDLCFKRYDHLYARNFCDNCKEQPIKMNLCQQHLNQLVGTK